jgi:hypothetical protein
VAAPAEVFARFGAGFRAMVAARIAGRIDDASAGQVQTSNVHHPGCTLKTGSRSGEGCATSSTKNCRMTPDTIAAWTGVITALVIGASAIAALVQLRHMRTSNQLEALISMERDFRSADVQTALIYVQDVLPERLEDPAYRAGLEKLGYVDVRAHPELALCNWFNEMGALLKHGLVLETVFMDIFARMISYYWDRLAGVIAIMRRSRGDFQYHDFEFLAMRAKRWLKRHPSGIFPRSEGRLTVIDPWLGTDAGAKHP